MSIEEVIRKNKTYNIFLKEAIKSAENILTEIENVRYAIGCNISIIDNKESLKIDFWKLKGKLSGVLVITNKRVIFCNSALGLRQTKEILLPNIQSVDSRDVSFLGVGKLRIKGITETFMMDVAGKETIEQAKKAIYDCKEEKNKVNQISNADEIMKFKQLLDEGIITQEEFERKKQELLK